MKAAERSNDARMMTCEQAAAYTGMGRTTFRVWADKIGATRRFGERLIRFDRIVIDKALDSMKQE